jgi:pilus assembly protein CpaE
MGALSLMLIAPQEERRRAMAKALAGPQASIARELSHYPKVDDLAEILETGCDAVVIDLDPDPERGLDVIENICAADNTLTVMVYSSHANPDLLVRCMRSGAREFLAEPLSPGLVAEALVRASARRDEMRRQKKPAGKLLVFAAAKGGSGVTTVASNFAVALARHSGGKAALFDLDLRLGDAALTLGITAKFSALDALENTQRLDSDFLSVLMAKHSSGLAVLAAPDNIPNLQLTNDGLEKLLRVARENFAYVVVDAGSQAEDMHDALFEMATTVYLVTQVSVIDLRNSNRFISRYFSGAAGAKLEIVLNRFLNRNIEIDEPAITKALTRPVKWKIPNDFAAVRRAQNTGTPMASENGQVARVFMDMASAASGQAMAPEKKKKFGLFG